MTLEWMGGLEARPQNKMGGGTRMEEGRLAPSWERGVAGNHGECHLELLLPLWYCNLFDAVTMDATEVDGSAPAHAASGTTLLSSCGHGADATVAVMESSMDLDPLTWPQVQPS